MYCLCCLQLFLSCCFFFSSRRRHTRCLSDWSSDVCSSDLSSAFERSRGRQGRGALRHDCPRRDFGRGDGVRLVSTRLRGGVDRGGAPPVWGAGRTTALGGISDGGTVFALYRPASGGAWTEKVLYRFEVQDGLLPVPNGNLAIGKSGGVFGTTAHGGIFARSCSYGCGLVFALYPSSAGGAWTETVLYSFGGGSDGAGPLGGLVIGEEGALYGTTLYGGDPSCKHPIGCGTAFQLVP